MTSTRIRNRIVALCLASVFMMSYLVGCGFRGRPRDGLLSKVSMTEAVTMASERTESALHDEAKGILTEAVTGASTAAQTEASTTAQTEASTTPFEMHPPSHASVNPDTPEDAARADAQRAKEPPVTQRPRIAKEDYVFNTSEDLHHYLCDYYLGSFSITMVGLGVGRTKKVTIGLKGDDPTALQELLDSLPIDHSWYEIKLNVEILPM